MNTTFNCLITPLKNVVQDTTGNITQGFIKFSGQIYRYFLNTADEPSGYMIPEGLECNLNQILNDMQTDSGKFLTIAGNCLSEPIRIRQLAEGFFGHEDIVKSFLIDTTAQIEVLEGTAKVYGKVFDIVENVFSYNNITSIFGFAAAYCNKENLANYIWEYFGPHTPFLDGNGFLVGLENDNTTFNNINDPLETVHASSYAITLSLGAFAGYIGYLIGRYYQQSVAAVAAAAPQAEEQSLYKDVGEYCEQENISANLIGSNLSIDQEV